ncbi:hypothetical protein PENTCL1PPCAC_21377 [Pristionchus entomophagus]|uniref:P-type domain-containing protein n=1 Tax=Pristionchus entomophagus TaxID=358040 RepID=A0AAV5TYD5_9BILA|nr:hypothetical protein PENTCL1PPCAC_21377 [Pristionchus entomophagus]
MTLLKALLVFFALLAVALAHHGEHEHSQLKNPTFDEEIPKGGHTITIKRCKDKGELARDERQCPDGWFCLYDDWRAIVTNHARFDGWCMPQVAPNRWDY